MLGTHNDEEFLKKLSVIIKGYYKKFKFKSDQN